MRRWVENRWGVFKQHDQVEHVNNPNFQKYSDYEWGMFQRNMSQYTLCSNTATHYDSILIEKTSF